MRGLLFVRHGTQKLFGWFGGHDLEGTGQHFESLGPRPGRRQALAAGAAEMVGGSLLAAGALTPLAGTVMSATMVTAVRRVLLEHGLWIAQGGYECALPSSWPRWRSPNAAGSTLGRRGADARG
ncbi:MAG: DoxX family protein [Solirubrobacteraceae bacterium]